MGTGNDVIGLITSVSCHATHSFSKPRRACIKLLAGLGVEGDAHMGVLVKHRSRVKKDPTQPNLRQVHLIHEELHDELRHAGFRVAPGDMGENITTRGIDLLALPQATRLYLGDSAVIEVSGLRNPCTQLNTFQPGLMSAVLERSDDGTLIRKAGIMAVVLTAGEIRPGDIVRVEWPPAPREPLECV